MITCKNCGTDFEGNFCSNCGQKADIHRFTIKHAVHEFLHAFTHIDRGLPYLIKELFIRPGTVAKEYIEGKRYKYFNPVQYLILAVAVAFFLSVNYSLMGPKVVDEAVYSNLNESVKTDLQFNQFIYKYFNLIMFIAVPVMALFSWLFFKKSGYNYAENIILNSFLAAQRTFMFILITPFLYFFRNYWYIFIGIYYLGWLIYFGWAFTQFYGGRKIVVILKYILMLLVFLPVIQGVSRGIFYLFFYHK